MSFKGQRVGVFVDIQNLYYSAKFLYKSYVNFSAILKKGVGNGQLVRAIGYGIKTDPSSPLDIYRIDKEQSFFRALKKLKFEVKLKDLQIFPGGVVKGNWDVGITVDIIRLAPKLDAVVLASGDGDFVDLIEYLKNHGIYVVIFAFGKSASSNLIQKADKFVDMDKDLNSFLLKRIK
jgi:uncharacterized LabA/DUF88 family protein